jgi:hypothetical protein
LKTNFGGVYKWLTLLTMIASHVALAQMNAPLVALAKAKASMLSMLMSALSAALARALAL